MTASEAQHYHELGLGRGINVTHSDMLKSRSPCLVRQAGPSLENVISTKESGTLERYEKEVATVSGQLKENRHSLHNPTALMKLVIDEQYTQSSCSTKLIKGKKIEKHTISFKSHFDDIQLYDTIDTATIDAPDCFLPKDSDYSFEKHLASWFLKCIHDREKLNGQDTKNSPDNVPDTGGESQVKKLAAKLKELAAQDTSWFESEQFFIKCSHHFFKMDGYIATMVTEAKSQSQDPKTSSQSQESEECGLLQALKNRIKLCCQYKVTVVGSVVGSNPDTQGMLFKLHPKGTQEKAKHDAAEEAAGKSSTDTQPPETSN